MHSSPPHVARLQRLAASLLGSAAVEQLDEHQRLQALIAILTSLLGAITALATIFFAHSLLPSLIVAAAWVSTGIFAMVLPLYRSLVPRSPQSASIINQLVPAGLFVTCGSGAVLVGGGLPVAAIYAPAIPLLSVMTCTWRATFFWSGIMVAAMVFGIISGPILEMPPAPPWLALAGGVTVLIPTLLSLMLHRLVWEGAVERERQAQIRLSSQHAEQRALDKRLYDHDRSQSLELLAGRVAHDLNNFLTSITGNAGLARMELEDGRSEEAQAHLGAIEAAATSAFQLSGNLLDHTGDSHQTLQSIAVTPRLRTAVGLAQASLTGEANIEIADAQDAWIEGDPTQFDQLVVNLLRNAVQSYDDDSRRRTVHLRVEVIEVNEQLEVESPRGTLPEANYVHLEVRDQGRGIRPAIRDRVFDPFFTDRTDGKGLGLASVAGIVQSHGGGIRLDSQEGTGTTVHVYLPAAKPTSSADTTRPAETDRSASASRVLVVDDQDAVRNVVGRMLRRLGFDPEYAADGLDGLQAVHDHGPFSLAVIDLVMPRCNGSTMLEKLRRDGIDVPVILMSGYAGEARAALDTDDPRTRFLQKPFSAEVFTETVHGLGLVERRR